MLGLITKDISNYRVILNFIPKYQILSFAYFKFDFIYEFIPPRYEYVNKRIDESLPLKYEIINKIKCGIWKWLNLILWYEIENDHIFQRVFCYEFLMLITPIAVSMSTHKYVSVLLNLRQDLSTNKERNPLLPINKHYTHNMNPQS